MSAHFIVSREAEARPTDTLCLNPDLPVLVAKPVAQAAIRSHERLLGALGLTVIVAILGLGIYSVVRYLL